MFYTGRKRSIYPKRYTRNGYRKKAGWLYRKKPFNYYRFKKSVAAIAASNSGPIVHRDNTTAIYPTDSGTIACLSDIAQGITEHTRRGEEMRLLSIRCRGYVTLNVTATNTIVRHIVLRSKRDEGGIAPAIDDVLEVAHVNALTKQDTKSEFIILYDKKYAVCNTGNKAWNYEFYINLKNVKARYDGPAAADYTRGHLFHIVISNEDTYTPAFHNYYRVYMRSV